MYSQHLNSSSLNPDKKTHTWGTSLAVHKLRVCVSNAGGSGSNPGQRTKMPHAQRHGPKKKKRPTDNLETGRHMKTEGDGVRKLETDQKEKLVLGVGEETVSELGQKGRGGAGLGRRWVGP